MQSDRLDLLVSISSVREEQFSILGLISIFRGDFQDVPMFVGD